MSEQHVLEVADGVFRIDLRFQGEPGAIAAYLLADGDDLALVETGPTSSLDSLLAGVRTTGHDPERIRQLILTHIHLDHAGAAGSLARRLPQAQVLVHPVGAPHLIDPSKLISSATRIYGDDMDRLWGEMLPVPGERVTELEDGATVRAGGRALRALHTPGHASHHIAFHDPSDGLVFAGDVAGVRLEGAAYVRPPTPPPDLDLELWTQSIDRLRALRPERLLLTHFGAFDDVDAHFDRLLARLFFWAGWIGARLEQGGERDRIRAELQCEGDADIRRASNDPDLPALYELATPYGMTVDGYARYFRKLARE